MGKSLYLCSIFIFFNILPATASTVIQYEMQHENRGGTLALTESSDNKFNVGIHSQLIADEVNGIVYTGEFDGVGAYDGKIMTVTNNEYPKCQFTIDFKEDYAFVTQTGTSSECGFGLNVDASGRYLYTQPHTKSNPNSSNADNKDINTQSTAKNTNQSRFLNEIKNSVFAIDNTTTIANAIAGYRHASKITWSENVDSQQRHSAIAVIELNKDNIYDIAKSYMREPINRNIYIHSKWTGSREPIVIKPKDEEFSLLFTKVKQVYISIAILVLANGGGVKLGGSTINFVGEDGKLIWTYEDNEMSVVKSIYANNSVVPQFAGKSLFEIAKSHLANKYTEKNKNY